MRHARAAPIYFQSNGKTCLETQGKLAAQVQDLEPGSMVMPR